jgi:hypothetical protein
MSSRNVDVVKDHGRRDRSICALAGGLPFVSSANFGGGKPGFERRNLDAVTFTGLVMELVNATG